MRKKILGAAALAIFAFTFALASCSDMVEDLLAVEAVQSPSKTISSKKEIVALGDGKGVAPEITGEPVSGDDKIVTVKKTQDETGRDALEFTSHSPGTTLVSVPVKKGDKEGTAVYEVTVDKKGKITYKEIGAETSVLNNVDKFAAQDLAIYNFDDASATPVETENIKTKIMDQKLWVYSQKDAVHTAAITVTGTRGSDEATLAYEAKVEDTGAVSIELKESKLALSFSEQVSTATTAKDGVVSVERDGSKVVLTAADISAGASDSTVLTVTTSSGASYSYNIILSSYGRIVHGSYKGINFVANDSVNGNHINNNGDTITSVVEMEGFPRWHIPQMVTFLGNPTMTGYTFGGWFKAEDFSGQAVTQLNDADFGDNTGITLYAKWTANKYKIVFKQNNDRDDASGTMADMNCNYDREYTLTKNTFDRTSKGVTWLNWNSQNDGSGTEYADQAKVMNLSPAGGATVNMYARWKGNKYKVAFNSNVPDNAQPTVDPTAELTGEMADQNYECGIPQNLTANAYAIVGYTFGGWNTKADGTGENYVDSYNAYSLTVVDGDTFTMYAKWTPNANTAYTVRHLQQDYKSATELADTYTVKDTEAKSGTTWADTVAASKTYSGFTCEGVTQNHINADGSTVIDIKYRRHMFTVNFDVNNTYKASDSTATNSGSMASQNFVYGSPQNLSANAFAIVGYTFAGWATSSGGSKAYNDKADGSTASTSDGGTTTLYAKWTANNNTAYKVVHQKKRAGVAESSETENKTGTTGAQTAAVKKTYTGYTAASFSQTKILANGTASVTIVYNKNAYKVTFNGNGATGGSMSDQTDFYHGESKALTSNAFTRTDYKFVGWSESSTATSATWSNGASITLTSNKTLYAVWEEDLIFSGRDIGNIVLADGRCVTPTNYSAKPAQYDAAAGEPAGIVCADGWMLALYCTKIGNYHTWAEANTNSQSHSAAGFTSGWELPSKAVMDSALSNFVKINEAMAAAKGGDLGHKAWPLQGDMKAMTYQHWTTERFTDGSMWGSYWGHGGYLGGEWLNPAVKYSYRAVHSLP